MRLRTRAALAALDLVRAAPRALARPLAWPLAALLFAVLERKVTLANVARVFPRWPRGRRWKLAFHAYLQAARSLMEFFQADRYTDAEMKERVAVDPRDEDLFVRALAEGRGALILTGHLGNWAWLARRAEAGGYALAALSKAPKDPALGARLRRIQGFTTIDYGETRELVRWLRAGKPLAILMDQEPASRREGAVVPLLGQPTLTHTGAFRLARLTGAPMFTVFLLRLGPGRHHAWVEPFEASRNPDPERALAEDAARFNARLEKVIREAPDEWLWMYGRWRRLDRMRAREAAAAERAG